MADCLVELCGPPPTERNAYSAWFFNAGRLIAEMESPDTRFNACVSIAREHNVGTDQFYTFINDLYRYAQLVRTRKSESYEYDGDA
jgi:hypothetical protein